jgi:hypothetical protein
MFKAIFAFLLLASPVLAQDQAATARAASGCGPAQVDYDVKTDKKQHPVGQVEPGRALVYVIAELKTDDLGFRLTGIITKVGLDSNWVGANRGQSYFFFSVDPGEHQICTNWQSALGSRSKLGSALTFTAEPGKVYYFHTQVYAITGTPHEQQYSDFAVEFEPIDPAEGHFLISSSPFSISKPKK